MKKIIAIVLALVCCFSIVACGEDETVSGVDATVSCYANSQPTKVEASSVQTIVDEDGAVIEELEGSYLLVAGKSGGKIAAQKIVVQETLDSIVDGSGVIITGPVNPGTKTVEEYLEGMGRRTNGGNWRSKGLNFAPSMGSIAINITNENVINPVYVEAENNNKLTFTVANEKIAEVFGTDKEGVPAITADSDVIVEITNNGDVVTGITVSFSIDEYDDFPARNVSITTKYSYEPQLITIE